MSLKQLIISLVKDLPGLQPPIVVGKVTAVDTGSWTCTVEVEECYTRNDVRIRAIEDGTNEGFILKPKVGSQVTIKMGENERNLWFLDMVSEVDEVYLKGDANGGIPIAENIKDKLNRLENKVNDLVNSYNTHTHSVPQAPSGTTESAPTTAQQTTINPLTQTSDLESTTVLHG